MNSKMKTWEWLALIFVTLVLDIIQFGLTLLVIGLVLNRIIDVIVGFALPIFFWFRGVNMGSWKNFVSAIGCFGIEEIGLGGDDALPFWTLEVIAVWTFTAIEKKAAKVPLLNEGIAVVEKMNGAKRGVGGAGPLNTVVDGKSVRLPQIDNQPLNQGGVRAPLVQNSLDSPQRRMGDSDIRRQGRPGNAADDINGLQDIGDRTAEHEFGRQMGDGDFSAGKGAFIKDSAGRTVFQSHEELKEAADNDLHPSAQIPKFKRVEKNDETSLAA